jgi:hypothetical protein
MCVTDPPISQPSLDISPIWTPVTVAEVKKYTTPSSVDWGGNLCFCVGTTWRICLSSDDFYSDSSLVQDFIRVEFSIF